MWKGILIIICFSLVSSNSILDDEIMGTYYLAAYSKEDLESIIYLKKELPKFEDTIYRPEDDVDRIVDFMPNGKIVAREFPNTYFCGFERIEMKNGSWKKLSDDLVRIKWEGISWRKNFEIESNYKVTFMQNGDVKLEPIF